MAASKEDQSKAFPLTNADLKLIAVGVRFTGDGGKLDYEKIAQYCGYTKGSAQVMYRKAYRKLFEELPGDIPASEARPSTPKAKGGRAGTGASAAKKRKAAPAAEDAAVDSPTPGEPATPGDAFAGFDSEARTPTKTPAKRQRKSPVKKTAVGSDPVKKEEQDSDDQNDVIKTEQLEGVFTTAGL